MLAPMRVYVLLFNPRTENEGIHSVRVGDRDKIFMFKSEDDATRYALMLEAQDFPVPVVEEMPEDEVIEFCNSQGFDYEVLEEGMLVLPPEGNLESTDWQADGANDPSSESSPESSPETSDLDRIRRQLEGLL